MLKVKSLSCQRGYQQLFTNLNINLDKGDILRITGYNGKGKTSLLKMIAGLNLIEDGCILFLDHSISSQFYQENIIYLGHLNALNPLLSVLDNLSFLIRLKQDCTNKEIKDALEKVGLKYYENVLCNTLSAGQKRRILLASLLLTKARLWLLDEPLTALDTNGVALIEELILNHSKRGGICIFTTHQATSLKHQTLEL